MWKKIKPYVISVAIALAVGGLSALLTKDSMDVYGTINLPPLAPPSWLFPVAWGILYVLMGISAAIVYTKDKDKKGLLIYTIQLGVNFFWSIIFFNMRAFLFSFLWLVLLWFLVAIMILQFRKTSNLAAYLQIPYLLWLTFAGYLNFMIYILN